MRQQFPFLVAALTALIAPASAQDLLWTRQAGTTGWDACSGVAADRLGNAYISGTTSSSLGGQSAGLNDYFLAKYDASSVPLWTRQSGTSQNDNGRSVAVDGAGNAYITGETAGSLAGTNAGGTDAFLAKYDASGILLWTRQTGTAGGDEAYGVAVDGAGNTYICGYSEGSLGGPNAGRGDYFLAKYDASGVLLWMRQAGTPSRDGANDVAVDGAGNAYITGHSEGSLGGPNAGGSDAFLAKYDASGSLLWTRMAGTSLNDLGQGVAVDIAGNAYVTGRTEGSLGGPNAGGSDAFLAKYAVSGVLLWTRQIGTSAEDVGTGVAVDSGGNAHVSGYTRGSLGGPNAGEYDAFLTKYDALGTMLWTRQAGTSASDQSVGVALVGAGNAYITGQTEGSLGGPNAGDWDYFLAKYGDACYPDCDQSTGVGVLDVFDFLCFQNSFVNAEPYACDCDTSTGNGVCDVFDFLCFQDAFVGGCP